MNHFSQTSLERLRTCEPDLQELFHHVLQTHDCTILTGHRTQADQQQAFDEGKSQVVYPNSKHNKYPSLAVDAAPYPIDWEDHKRFVYFAGIVKGIATGLGMKIRWGGDWNSDNRLSGRQKYSDPLQKFDDLVHFELVI